MSTYSAISHCFRQIAASHQTAFLYSTMETDGIRLRVFMLFPPVFFYILIISTSITINPMFQSDNLNSIFIFNWIKIFLDNAQISIIYTIFIKIIISYFNNSPECLEKFRELKIALNGSFKINIPWLLLNK